MRGLTFAVEAPYFACFRRPTATSSLLTFPLPPPSTLFGMILNAMGVESKRDTTPYFLGMKLLQERVKINISPLSLERPVRELAEMLKLIEREVERRPRSFPSSPIFKELLVRPSYKVYLASKDEALIGEIAAALRNPARPLYIGQSDDMAVVDLLWEGEVRKEKGKKLFGLLRGTVEGCELLRLPFGFEENSVLYLPLLSLPKNLPFELDQPREAFIFDGEAVELFGVEDVVRQKGRRAFSNA
ncbi:hypothetical protein DRP77_07440 [Candidatus Poribacteria bacterium]|nr:MAG: hypothetical protein DRP77_07440 [Candidatus Poribacteria bacterium]